VTAMSRASSSSLKRKIKRNSKKRNIKSRKIDKRERKMLVLKRSITESALKSEKHIFANLMKLFSIHQQISKLPLSYWMLVSKTRSLYLLFIYCQKQKV